MGTVPVLDLTFPDVPRTELERAVDDLTAGAQRVLAAQGRLRQLLRASAAVVSDLDQQVVLERIVTAARDLVGGGFAAIMVSGEHSPTETFVQVGLDADQVAAIYAPPVGLGILALLVREQGPVRLADLTEHPASAGMPHHPRMRSLLGVPVRVRDTIVAHLFVTHAEAGRFTDEDEQLLTALAATAGVAVSHARLYTQAQQQRQWLRASTELTQRLFARTSGSPVHLVLEYAMQGAGADMATLVLPGEHGQGTVRAAGGVVAATEGQVVDLGETVAGQVITTGRPVMTTDHRRWLAEHGRPNPAPVPVGPVIGVPLLGAQQQVTGALTVARRAERPPFTSADCDQLAGFAGSAGVALELDRARTRHELERSTEDRLRIALDLDEQVIQQLFATGLGMQGLVPHLSHPEHRERLEAYVEALDDSIRRIRESIFDLQDTATHDGEDVKPDDDPIAGRPAAPRS